jgi:hypothetical protein
LPGAIKLKELTTALLTLVTLSTFAITVLDRLCGVAVETFHLSILPKLSLRFQQRPITAVYLLENRRKVAEAGLKYSLDIKFLHALALC